MLLFTKGFKQAGFMHSGLLFSISIAVIAIIAIFTHERFWLKGVAGSCGPHPSSGFIFLIIDFAVIYLRLFQSTESNEVIRALGSNINPQDNFSRAQKIAEKFQNPSNIESLPHRGREKSTNNTRFLEQT